MQSKIISLLDTNIVTRCTGGKTKKRCVSDLIKLDKKNITWNRLVRGGSIHTVDINHVREPGEIYLPYTTDVPNKRNNVKRLIDIEPLTVGDVNIDTSFNHAKYNIVKLEGKINNLHACSARVLDSNILFVKDGRTGEPKAMTAIYISMLFKSSDMVFVLCDAGGRPGWVPLTICRVSQALVSVDTIVNIEVHKPVDNCNIMLVSGNFLIGGIDLL